MPPHAPEEADTRQVVMGGADSPPLLFPTRREACQEKQLEFLKDRARAVQPITGTGRLIPRGIGNGEFGLRNADILELAPRGTPWSGRTNTFLTLRREERQGRPPGFKRGVNACSILPWSPGREIVGRSRQSQR